MKQIDKYVLRNFGYYLRNILISLVFIYVLIDLFDGLSRYVDHKASALVIAKFYFYFLPYIINLMFPVAILMAALFTVNTLSAHNEIMAFKASGVSALRVILPIIIFGFLASIVSFFWDEYVVSYTFFKRSQIRDMEIYKKSQKNKPIWRYNITYSDNNNNYLYIRKYNIKDNKMFNLTYIRSAGNRIVERFDAVFGKWQNGKWIFTNANDRYFTENGIKYGYFQHISKKIYLQPKDLVYRRKTADEMGYKEIKEVVAEKRRKGEKDLYKFLVNLHLKFAYPLANLIVAIIGATFSLSSNKRKRNSGLFIGLILAFTYLVFLRIGQAFGYSGYMDPVLAAWLSNIVFSVPALFLIIKARSA